MAEPELRRNYKNVFDALIRTAKEEGFGALYKGLAPNIFRGMSMNVGMLACYDQAKVSNNLVQPVSLNFSIHVKLTPPLPPSPGIRRLHQQRPHPNQKDHPNGRLLHRRLHSRPLLPPLRPNKIPPHVPTTPPMRQPPLLRYRGLRVEDLEERWSDWVFCGVFSVLWEVRAACYDYFDEY